MRSRLRSVVANGDEGERQICNESEREAESEARAELRSGQRVVADGDEGERQR